MLGLSPISTIAIATLPAIAAADPVMIVAGQVSVSGPAAGQAIVAGAELGRVDVSGAAAGVAIVAGSDVGDVDVPGASAGVVIVAGPQIGRVLQTPDP